MANYYQKDIETASYEKIREIQNERLVKTINHVYKKIFKLTAVEM